MIENRTEMERYQGLELLAFDEFQLSEIEINVNGLRTEVNQLIQKLNKDLYNTIENDQKLHYLLSTEICEIIKQYILFLRNLMLEKISATTKHDSNILSKDQFEGFLSAQTREYQGIKKEFQAELMLALSLLDENSESKELDKNLALVKNPIEIYKAQFQSLKAQFQNLISLETQVTSLSLKFNYVKKTLGNEIGNYISRCEEIKSGFEILCQLLETDAPNIQLIEEKLKKFEKISETFTLNKEFEESLLKFIVEIDDIKLVKNYNLGVLYFNEIKTSSLLKRWLNYQILPKLRNINSNLYDQQVRSSRFIHSLLAGYGSGSDKDFGFANVIPDVENRKKENLEEFSKAQIQYQEINNQVFEHLTVYAIQENESWNESLFYTTYSQVVSNTESVFGKLKFLIDRVFLKAHNFFSRYDYNRPIVNELIVDFLKHRISRSKNNFYQKIFFDSTRFKEHFLIDRKTEQLRLKESINNWEKGFGNSVIIYGKTHCGKSSFISANENIQSFDHIIYVNPGAKLTIEGRKFETSFDMDHSISEIKKHLSINHTYCLVIDDLEYWSNSSHSLLKNSKSIIKHVDNAQDNIFFIVSTNSKLFHTLNSIIDFRSAFTSEIELSRMHVTEFIETVLHRNETTQQTLMYSNGDALSNSDIVKIARKIFKANGEIVGSSLIHWVGNIDETNRIKQFEFDASKLPKVVTPENLYLFDLLLMHKSIAQIHLINMIPLSKRDFVRNQIGRFVKLNIINRDDEGLLSISPLIINDIYLQTSYKRVQKNDLNHFILSSVEPVTQDLFDFQTKLQECLLSFPFKYEKSKVTIDKIQDTVELSIMSMEMPSQFLKHLGSGFENFQFEFKKNL
jgi:hypothetical protein